MSKNKKSSKKVINIETGEIFHSVRYCAKINNLSSKTLQHWLNGTRKNKSVFRYV